MDYYLSHKDTEFEWGPHNKWADDGEYVFNANLKKYPNDKCLLHYRDNPLLYKTNKQGYRSPCDIEKDFDGNLYLGCSQTYGIGHYWENTWVSLLNNKIGGKCLNLGVPGTGIGTGARTLNELKYVIKPKNIFCNYIHRYRFEFWDWEGKYWRTISPNFVYEIDRPNAKVPKEMMMFLTQEEYKDSYYQAQFALIKNIAQEIGAKLYTIPLILPNQLRNPNENTSIPFKARDLLHPTTMWHNRVADTFYKTYTNNFSLL